MNKVSIIAANALIRSGTQTLLSQCGVPPDCITAFETVARFLAWSERRNTVILLLDDEPYMLDIETVINQLLDTHSSLQIILLSERLLASYIRLIMKQGAGGFIYKDGDMEQSLSHALAALRRGTKYLSPEVSEMLLNSEMTLLSGLSKRDMAVLQLMAAEMHVQQIAYQLKISDRTVYRSRTKLREVLAVQTNERIVDAARQQGLLNDA